MLMGKQRVSIDILHQVLSSSSKLFHGLVSSNLNPKDHQNYTSCWRISRDEVFEALQTISQSDATSIYIRILRSIIDAYIEKSTSLLDRVFHAWVSVFLSRLWLAWIDKMGKSKLDQLLSCLTKNTPQSHQSSRNSTQQYLMTPQAVYSIELNAHCLVYLILLVIENKLPNEVLSVERFHSQSCESIFRTARAFSSRSFSGVNFTVLQFMNLADKLSLFQKIKHRNEQSASPSMKFPIHHKNNRDRSSSHDSSLPTSPLTKTMLEATVVRAFEKASEYAEQVGMINFLRSNKLSGITAINDYVRTLFDEKKILDSFSQNSENDDDEDEYSDDLHYDRDDDDDTFGSGSKMDGTGDDEEASSILEDYEHPESLQPKFRGIRVSENIPSHLSESYFKVCIDGNDRFIHKSSACWILTEKNQKLSSDRTQRVTQSK